jgi:hypothetical protein
MLQSLESLESRRLMTVTASAVRNTLYVWGVANPNGITVVKSGSSLVVEQYVSGSGYVPFFTADAGYGVTQIRIMGYAGPDTITVAPDVTQTTTIYGGPGADWIEGGGGTNYLWGHGDWADDPSGTHNPATDDNAADHLIGGKGTNFMWGQRGNDAFFTSTEAATTAGTTDGMYGGNGTDTFETSRPNGNATAVIFGQNGNDTFSPNVAQPAFFFGGAGWDSARYANDGQFFDQVYGDNKDGSSAAGYTDVATIDAQWIFSDYHVGVETIA